jgi:small nuclear ribonucleoprotein
MRSLFLLSLGETSLFKASFTAPEYNLFLGRNIEKNTNFYRWTLYFDKSPTDPRRGNRLAEMIEKVLERSVGKTVLIKVRGGRTLRGILEGFDQHVNLYMSDAEEVSDMENVRSIGAIVLRGDNVIMISPPPE